MSIPWTEKYRPKKLDDIVGQPQALKAIREWIEGVRSGRQKKALLLYGPPGTGKTSAAYAIAGELGMDVVEINSSDIRSRERLERILENLRAPSLLTGRRRMILFDEIDSLPREASAIASIVRKILESRAVVVMTANDPYERHLIPLRELSVMVRFNRIRWTTVRAVLRRIASSEGVSVPDAVLTSIAKNCKGDLRAAINDLEAVSRGDLSLAPGIGRTFGVRDVEQSIFDLLRGVFFWKSCVGTRAMAMNVDVDPETVMRWVEENLPSAYADPEMLERAYEYLARGDVFFGRIVRSQNWRLLSYGSDMITLGVCSVKHMGGRVTSARFSYPSTIKMMARVSSIRQKMRRVCRRVGALLHVSGKVVKEEILPILALRRRDRGFIERLSREANVEREELAEVIEYFSRRVSS